MEVLADERGLYHRSHPYSTILQVVTSSMQTVIFHIFPHYRYCSVYLTFLLRKHYTIYPSVPFIIILFMMKWSQSYADITIRSLLSQCPLYLFYNCRVL